MMLRRSAVYVFADAIYGAATPDDYHFRHD